MDPDGEMFDLSQLKACAPDGVKEIVNQVEKFMRGAQLADDMVVFQLEYTGKAPLGVEGQSAGGD